MSDVTRILTAIENGDSSAANELLPIVYQELRKLAAAKLSKEKPGQTLQATILVHEAYVRLVEGDGQRHWNGRGHFFGAAAEAMRRILIENARRKKSQKRAGVIENLDVEAIAATPASRDLDLLALDEAMTEFEQKWPDKATLVKLKYFAGLTTQEVAQTMGVSVATVERHWTFARTWLHLRLREHE